MNELNFPEEAVNDEMKEDDFEIYNNKEMNQEEVADCREVQEEETHRVKRPNQLNEIVIIRKPSELPLFPEEEENNIGDEES
jgi:predicted patatin/cPLA2 family phospholipase